ncbi:membrane bound O-acyl transferase family-domain-containing protein [Trametes elegans]|nr:membrane bound O-acyl transferase family-domain-containing protein [Trametes elegans]
MSAAYSTPFAYDGPGKPTLPFAPLHTFLDAAIVVLMVLRPPFVVRAGATLLVFYVLVHAALKYSTGDPTEDYLAGVVFGGIFFSQPTLVLLTDPLRDVRYIEDPAPLCDKPLRERIIYGYSLLWNCRFVGTNAQMVRVPNPFQGSRAQFILMRLRRLIQSLIVFDLCGTSLHEVVPLYYTADPATSRLATGLIGHVVHSAIVAATMVVVILYLDMGHIAASILAVALGLTGPQAWPDLFGSWSDAYTVSRAWGRVWHQMLRRDFTAWSNLAHRVFGIPRGGWLSGLVQINLAFNLSGLAHCVGDLMVSPVHFGRSWTFFALNGLVVTLESVVFALAKRVGIQGGSRALRFLGYAWVYFWFMKCSGPVYQEYLVEIWHNTRQPLMSYSPTKAFVVPYIRSLLLD